MERNATPRLREIARHLVAQETGQRGGSPALAQAAARVNGKLRQHLSKLVGPAAFHALLSRALVLARSEYAVLSGVTVDQDGDLVGMPEVVQRPDWSDNDAPALATVLANFLWLLVTLIGDDLALRLVRDVWPDVDRRSRHRG